MEDAGASKHYKKKELLGIVSTLIRANDTIVKSIKVNPKGVAEVLVSCQESAILIGNDIESREDKYGDLVKLLEDYCENIFQINEAIPDEIRCHRIAKEIQKQLNQLWNGINYELPDDRKEAVFLPYKASMWDSLESIWKAADADPDCDAYVIPIPYFDKNPDGTFREMHYEGDWYPKDVPITRYEDYDLEAHRPDVIYIHNPYDDWNYVTSVHPHFYAKNLRNYTDKLIYIPYFILGEIKPDNQEAIDGMKHFCFAPGIIYAHQVIVQSENMRQIYINEYIKAAREAGLGGEHTDRKVLEKKFLGTGSPKIDKVLHTKREDLEIPQEWLKMIEKPDGSWKKIIFYNTSVGALLQHSEKMLKKIESVFGIFKEHKDEVTLLWRPHPLIPATIKSMRPELWEKYKAIKDRYIGEDWGIYDDTSDIDRAVVLSDAYYGDGSSVVCLCREKGIPVIVQEVEKTEYSDNVCVSVIDAIIDNDKVWFFPYEFNSLFSMNLEDKKIELIGLIPDEAYGEKRLYESIKLIGEKIYFVPFYAKTIAVFDIKKRQFSNITLDEEKTGCSIGQPLFGGAEVYGKYLYMLPVFSQAFIRLNTVNDNVEYIVGWAEKVDKLRFNSDAYFRRQAILVEGRLMIPFCSVNAVMELDCKTTEYRIHKLGEEKRGYSGICFDGKNFWLSPRTDRVLVRWNPGAHYVEAIEMGQENEVQDIYTYVGLLSGQQKIMVFPSVKKEDVEVEDFQVALQEGTYTFAKEEGNNLIYFREDIGKLILINKNNDLKTEIDVKVRFEDIDKKRMIKEAQKAMSEGKFLNVEDLIEALQER